MLKSGAIRNAGNRPRRHAERRCRQGHRIVVLLGGMLVAPRVTPLVRFGDGCSINRSTGGLARLATHFRQD
jgi:hypothetical protein